MTRPTPDPTLDETMCASENKLHAIRFRLCYKAEPRRLALRYSGILQDRGWLSTCLKCNNSSAPFLNPPGSCCHHPGESMIRTTGKPRVELDSRLLIDRSVVPNIEEVRKSHPQGFGWDSCEGKVDSMGCTNAKHEARPDPVKHNGSDSSSATPTSTMHLSFS